MIDIDHSIDCHIEVIRAIKPLTGELKVLGSKLVDCLAAGGKILWMGNGGSAADSQHLAAELVVRSCSEDEGLASIALMTDTSIVTSIANDYGYEQVFARQIDALCMPDDAVIGISTSGKSASVIQGLRRAKERGAYTVCLTGRSGACLRESVDHCLVVPSSETARIQEAHILIGHLLCDLIEAQLGQHRLQQ